MRRSQFFLALMAFCVGLGLFRVKYQVMALEKNHKQVVKSISETRESIHVLKAELTHLNDPARLQKLADIYGRRLIFLRDSSKPAPLPESAKKRGGGKAKH